MRLHHINFVFLLVLLLGYSTSNCQSPFPDRNRNRIKNSNTAYQPTISSVILPDSFYLTSANTEIKNLLPLDEKIVSQPGNNNFSSLDTCATYTYRLKIGNAGSEEIVNGITTISSGNMLLSGKYRITGSDYQGLLIKLNPDGKMIWAKTYGEPGTNEDFYEARETADGGIIMIGSQNTEPVNEGWLLICKLDNNGNQQWTRRFKSPTTGASVRGTDIVEMTDNNILFIGDNSTAVLYGKLSATGALIWNKIATPLETVKSLRILEDYNGHFLTVTGTEGGFNVSCIFKVNLGDGSFVWNRKFGGVSANSNWIFQSVEMINLRPRITGIYAPVGQPYKFIRVTVNTGSNIELIEEFTVAGAPPDISSMSVQNPWSQALAFSITNNSTTVNLVKNSPEVNSVEWSCDLNNAVPFSISSLEKTADAGFIISCNQNNDIFLIKTDSIGQQPGCDRVATNTSNITTNPNIPTPSFGITNSTWQQNTNLINQAVVILDTVYYCKQLTCPVRTQEDTCLSSFYKAYRSYEFCEVVTAMSETSDNSVLVSGVVRSNPYESLTSKSFIAKLSKKGDLLAKQRWLFGSDTRIFQQLKLNDGNTLLSGYCKVGPDQAIFLIKIDNNLNIIWNKTYKITTSSFWYYIDLAETAGNEILLYMFYLDFPALNDRWILLKFDSNGNQIWQKSYRSTSSVSLVGASGSVVCEGNYFYCNSMVNYNNKYHTVVAKFDINTGNIIWNKRYDYNNSGTILDKEMLIKNGKLYLVGSVDYLPNDSRSSILKLSSDGNVENLALFNRTNTNFGLKITTTTNSDIASSGYVTDYSTNPTTVTDYFFKLDSNLAIKYSKKSPAHDFTSVKSIFESSEGDFFVGGSNFYDDPYSADIFLKRYLSDGTIGGCSSDSFDFVQVFTSLNTSDYPLNNVSISALQSLSPALIQDAFPLQQNRLYCSSASGCDSIWLQGNTNICDSVNVYTYIVQKNPGCTAPVTWNANSPYIQITQSNDSLIKIRFLQTGLFSIKAKIYSGCNWLQDSLPITVVLAPDTLNLGPDSTLCPNNTQLLNAHSGYISYLWQDGSTDSTFSVTAPGIYWVEVKDACNNISRDSVTITAAPPIPLDLGPDLTKCNNDSLTITAPSGFINYAWSPNYNISTTNGQVVIVFPAVDTMYKLKAEKTPGCFAFDSIRITVKTSPVIYLGSDTSFCDSDLLILNAGTGFTNYLWSTGQTTQSITVYSPGSYSINAIAPNGCLSKDTLKVLNVYSNPVINLGPDSPICEGTTRQLNAGAGYISYLWNTGSNSQSIMVSVAGAYWVIVTDANQCKGTDTTIITSILPSPKNFLPADTFLCSYSSITLRPLGTFTAYLWSTGSVTPSIVVSSPGIYSLEVNASNSCTGKDTIIVNPKQCLEGFYIPSAFTPNNDGKNDLFRPLLFGNVLKYEFIIYNRWGEIVFKTKDLQNGWNGKVNGLDTDTNIFVWQCNFQFGGKSAESRKGTVTLIH